ncbi:neprilysin-11-like [Uranotaenia lowii]|uniref:neprilysin-11-like n=1 Tax=Uranotaenia lowii TaxID=190385 RepID=UPI00247A3C9E|nr:neprilysin-11-like [Uranotaenia lowii]XP_055608290.1 neprilysin-11-like [Uranotaenia lowii]
MAAEIENNFLATNIELTNRYKTTDVNPSYANRTKVDSRCHVLCRRFFICILLVAVVFLSGVIYGIYHFASLEPDVCRTQECLRSAAVLKLNMNPAIDPCEDFYKYACGRWAEEHPRPDSHTSYNWYSERQVKIYNIIRARLEANISRSDPRPVRQAKAMYIGCQSPHHRKTEGFKSLAKYLKEFGLPLLPTLLTRTLPKKSHSFDWVSSVAKIQRKLGLNVLVGFDIVPDHQEKSIKRLTLEYPYDPQDFNFPTYEWSKKFSVHKRLKSKSSEETDHEDLTEEEGEEENEVEQMEEVMKTLIEAVDPSMNVSKSDERIRELSVQYLNFGKSIPKVNSKEI